ncbi:MAG: Aerobic carbon monoxide dehydrogenase (quinone), medium chain, partial [uncultured Solirubrobacteraceae bacterium]
DPRRVRLRGPGHPRGGARRAARRRRGREDPRGRALAGPADEAPARRPVPARRPAQGRGPGGHRARGRGVPHRGDDEALRGRAGAGPRLGGARREHDRRPAGPLSRHAGRHPRARGPGLRPAGDLPGDGGQRLDHGVRRDAGGRGARLLLGLPHDRGRGGRDPHRGAAARDGRLRVRLREVQPPPGGLGDGRGGGPRQEGRRRHLRGRPGRADPSRRGAAPRDRRGGRAARPAARRGLDRRGGGARRRWHRAAGGPQRERGLQAPSRDGALPAGAGAGRCV